MTATTRKQEDAKAIVTESVSYHFGERIVVNISETIYLNCEKLRRVRFDRWFGEFLLAALSRRKNEKLPIQIPKV
jgi:hypothetical protein